MKKIVIAGILAIMIGLVYAVYAGPTSTGNTDANTQAFIGTVCFNTVGYSDTHVLRVDLVGNALQVTGHDPVYPSSMDGGGAVVNGHLLLQIDEAAPAYAMFANHNIDIDLATMTGTDDFRWSGLDGVVFVSYLDLPYAKVPCPTPGAAKTGSTSAGK